MSEDDKAIYVILSDGTDLDGSLRYPMLANEGSGGTAFTGEGFESQGDRIEMEM